MAEKRKTTLEELLESPWWTDFKETYDKYQGDIPASEDDDDGEDDAPERSTDGNS